MISSSYMINRNLGLQPASTTHPSLLIQHLSLALINWTGQQEMAPWNGPTSDPIISPELKQNLDELPTGQKYERIL